MLRIITLLLFVIINTFCIESVDIAEKMSVLRSVTVYTYQQPFDIEKSIIETAVKLSLDDILALNSPVLNTAITWMSLEDQQPIPLYEVDAETLQVLLGDEEVETTAHKLANAKFFLQIPITEQDLDFYSLEEWWQACKNFRQLDVTSDGEACYYHAPSLAIAKNRFVWRNKHKIFGPYDESLELLGVTDQYVICRNRQNLRIINYESKSTEHNEVIAPNDTVCISGNNSTLLYTNKTAHEGARNILHMLSLNKKGEVQKKIIRNFHNFEQFVLSYHGDECAYLCKDSKELWTRAFVTQNFVNIGKIDSENINITYAKRDNSLITQEIQPDGINLNFRVGSHFNTCALISSETPIADIIFTTVDRDALHASILRLKNGYYRLLIVDPNIFNPDMTFFFFTFKVMPIVAPQISTDGHTITVITPTMTLRIIKKNSTTWEPDPNYCNHELDCCEPLGPNKFDIQPISDYRQAIISPDGLTLATRNDAGTITIWEKISLYNCLME